MKSFESIEEGEGIKPWELIGQGREAYVSCVVPEGWDYEIVRGVQVPIPPAGYVPNPSSPKDLIFIGIDKKNKEEEDFYWVRNGLPKDYDQRRNDEIAKQREDETYVDPYLEEFRQASWIRRLSGCWFANGPNGDPVYITGLHYYYLEWCYIAAQENNGYPSFRSSDRRTFLFIEHCVKNPKSFGVLFLTKRRAGKTQQASAFGLEGVSRKRYANLGIQSKSSEDAEKVVFKDAVMRMFSRLPDFFQPVHDPKRSVNSKNTFSFKPAVGDKNSWQKNNYLGGWIEWRSSLETAFDGTKLFRYIGDEVFKTPVDVDIYERWNVVKYCLLVNGVIYGKAMITSTVEEIEGSVDTYMKFWKDSDHLNPENNGRTKTGLYRILLPGDEARNYDRYGDFDKEKNRSEILQEREIYRTDPNVYNSIVRKDPLTAEEAFRFVSRESIFNTIKISDQIDTIVWRIDELLEWGNYIWIEHMKEVKWSPSERGKWVRLKNYQHPDHCLTNLEGPPYDPMKLTGDAKFAIGVDPYSHGKTEAGKGSNGVIFVKAKHDPLDPDNSDMIVAMYASRPKDVDIFHDDVLITGFVYGCKILFENQKMGIAEYFAEHSASKMLLKVGSNTNPGIAATKKTLLTLVSLIETYIENSCQKIYYLDLLRDIANFKIEDTQDYDYAMAFGYCLLADSRILARKNKNESVKMIDIGDLF